MADGKVKRCCASCRYKQLTRTTMRYCLKKKTAVSPHGVCEQWEISDLLRLILKQQLG